MFRKIIDYLTHHGGFTEESLAHEVGSAQSTINRIKCGQEPRYGIGKALIDLHADALSKNDGSAQLSHPMKK